MIQSFHKRREDFKLTAVRAIKSGKSVAEVAKMCGVSERSVYIWWDKYKNDPRVHVPEAEERVLKKWKIFEEEFRMAAVQEVERGRKVSEVADECDVSENAVYEWCAKYSKSLQQYGPVVELKELQERIAADDEEQRQKKIAEQKAKNREDECIRAMLSDPLLWLQRHTKTKDSHWREHGADSPYRRFPDKPYFLPLMEGFQENPVIFVEKSRDLMLSWLFVGLFTHAAMTTEGIEVLFQSQKQEKACELVEYAKILYEQSDEAIRKAYPLAKKNQAADVLEFAHGSRIITIPGGGDQIRSYHPWGLLMDEAAFMPEAGESYDNAVPVCKKIVVLSSAGPGWFADICNAGT